MKDYSKSGNYRKARVRHGGSNEKLPPGAYQCVIKNAKVESYDWGDRLCIAIDITEGDHKMFFEQQFVDGKKQDEDFKWKGVLRINLPKDDGSDEDAWKQDKLKTTIADIEESNPEFVYNWDESTLKGKLVGIMFRTRYTVIGGMERSYTEAFSTISIEAIKSGDFKEPQPFYDNKWKAFKEGNGNTDNTGGNDGWLSPEGDDDEVPF